MAGTDARNPVSEYILLHRERIAETWRQRLLVIPVLANLPPAAVVDHMPEFLGELAAWIAGDSEAVARAYDQLVRGHALQRLGLGVDLGTLLTEYALLREVLLTELLDVASAPDVRRVLVQLNQALDLAITESAARFAMRRDEVRERFIGILGNDLRNPLQALMLGVDSILANPTCGQASHARLASAIRRGGERMSRMVQDVMDFALGHLGGGIPAIPQTCNMGELCRETIDELRAAHPDRELVLLCEGELLGSWDRDRCVQVISNLVSNALVHGVDPITVMIEEEPDHQHVVTRVHNFGAPIPAPLIPTLFDAFQRGVKARRGGLGLGLYIVHQIALAHGAICTVTSDAEAGTTFMIRWPRTPLSEVARPLQERA